MRTLSALISLLFINGLFAIPVLADSKNADTSAWQFELTPYILAEEMDGTAEMRGFSAKYRYENILLATCFLSVINLLRRCLKNVT